MQIGALSTLSLSTGVRQQLSSALANPAIVLFVSANLVNVGNLAFNILFSRWLGPELFSDLALLLTVKLSILCLLSAIQFEIAGRTARAASPEVISLAASATKKLLLVLLAVSVFISGMAILAATAFFSNWSELFTDHRFMAYALFATCLPFAAPLCILRGLSQGTLDLKYLVLSAQVEMGVRLFGAAIAWFCGGGLPGIAFAIALSIILGWWFAAPPASAASLPKQKPAPKKRTAGDQEAILGRTLIWAAMPWALLQLGQVIALDGDFLAIKLFFSAEESGLAAIAVLVQRILFFGCFGLASAILPMAAAANGRVEMLRAIAPVLALFALTTFPFIALMGLFPSEVIGLVFGNEYAAAAPTLIYSSISGACFVFVYLIATFFMARKRMIFGAMVAGMAFALVCVLAGVAALNPHLEVLTLIKIKAALLLASCAIFTGIAWNEFSKDQPGQVP